MNENNKNQSYANALVNNLDLNQSQNINPGYDQVLIGSPYGLPPYREIVNKAIQENLFNKVFGVIKGLQFLARNQMSIEEQRQELLIESEETMVAPLIQRPSPSISESKSNHSIDLHI